ncbi:FAD:protein FMN transferase [Shivajiella indica]|uniref:FAD:protein FMN transferase n=1 Tax=Shivajiella indica TaxID=872115 RepID=A0ABW5B7Y5_9BACT
MKLTKQLFIPLSITVLIAAGILWSEYKAEKEPFVFLEGKALGVFYSISYQGDPSLERELDSLINDFDRAVNINIPDSDISQFNKYGKAENFSPHLYGLLKESLHYYEISGGVVSHSILPLITAWGNEFSNKKEMTVERVDSLKALCDPGNIEITPGRISSRIPGTMLDLNYLDKGHLIDLLSEYFKNRGVVNFQMEFGLDGVSSGKPNNQNFHNFFTNIPKDLKGNNLLEKRVNLKNTAYSSSGSLDKFYVDDKGNKHSHLIDPRTGYPISNGILSTSIKAPSCIQADAMATICMILSLEESQKMINVNPDLEAMIIYNQNGILQIWQSEGFEK